MRQRRASVDASAFAGCLEIQRKGAGLILETVSKLEGVHRVGPARKAQAQTGCLAAAVIRARER